MKKLLLTLAASAVLAPAFNANAEATLTEVWKYQGHELNADWDSSAPNWSSADAIKSKSCTRFATGRDGRIYTINMMTMSIAEITKDGMKDLYKLPALEGDDYYGTAISMDEVGNFLVGHYFTKPELSSNVWTVYSPETGKYKHFDLGYPDGMKPEDYVSPAGYGDGSGIGRIDCVGRVVGDLTSDGLFFIAPFGFGGSKESGGGTANNIRLVYAWGDGNADATDLDGTEYIHTYLGTSSAQNIVQPAITSMDEFGDTPEDHYKSYIICSTEGGKWDIVGAFGGAPQSPYCAAFQSALRNLPYKAANQGFDSFVLDGRRYFIHGYINSEGALANNKRPMDIAVFNEAGTIVATWHNTDYAANNGYNSIVAQPLDDGTALIHVFSSCSSMTIGDMLGCGAAAVLKFAPESAEDMEGSESNPIRISTVDEFLTFNKKCLDGVSYVKLENDLDLTGVEYSVPFTETTAATKTIHFDGQNHVISNLKGAEGVAQNASVFGSYKGTIKNLGVENIDVNVNWFCTGGIVGATVGETEITNCFVTGSVQGAASGGIVGSCNGNLLTITNCYAWVNTADNVGGHSAGLVGRANGNLVINNAYASGSVTSGTGMAAGLVNVNTAKSVTLTDVIAWNPSVTSEGSAAATVNGEATANNVEVYEGMTVNDEAVSNGKSVEDLMAIVRTWDAFVVIDAEQLPILAWQNGQTGAVNDIEIDNSDAPAVYYNLQGIKVANPENGIYIVRRGNKVTKEIIR